MSKATSSFTGRRFGIQRVCRIWDQARSTVYSQKKGSGDQGSAAALKKRGPKPKISDQELLEKIREDLAASPFQGEGHRKVWARLRWQQDVRVSRKRVLRIMRENKLLSPRRSRRGEGKAHDGKITTDAPNEMWGTDGARVFTLDEGWIWIFIAVEHWNGECMGYHVCKEGTRYAALEPIATGLNKIYGSVDADVARGLSLRMDHGTQYTSDHFVKQIQFWGITPSFAFVEEPETNGVAERFIRTLKEQAIYGRIFRNVEEVREAVAAFVERYNQEWRLEKLGFRTPLEARAERAQEVAA